MSGPPEVDSLPSQRRSVSQIWIESSAHFHVAPASSASSTASSPDLIERRPEMRERGDGSGVLVIQRAKKKASPPKPRRNKLPGAASPDSRSEGVDSPCDPKHRPWEITEEEKWRTLDDVVGTTRGTTSSDVGPGIVVDQLRDSHARDSPSSHRSQDSGFSDSGDSSNGRVEGDGQSALPVHQEESFESISTTSPRSESPVTRPKPNLMVPHVEPGRVPQILERFEKFTSIPRARRMQKKLSNGFYHADVVDVCDVHSPPLPPKSRNRSDPLLHDSCAAELEIAVDDNRQTQTLDRRFSPSSSKSSRRRDDWMDLAGMESKPILETDSPSPKVSAVRFNRPREICSEDREQRVRFGKNLEARRIGDIKAKGPVQRSILKKQNRDFQHRLPQLPAVSEVLDKKLGPPLKCQPLFPTRRTVPINFDRFGCVNSVSAWARDLRVTMENECMSVLQAKPILSHVKGPLSDSSSSLPGGGFEREKYAAYAQALDCQSAIRTLQEHSADISDLFVDLCQRLENRDHADLPGRIRYLLKRIDGFLSAPLLRDHPSDQHSAQLLRLSTRLYRTLRRGEVRGIPELVAALGHSFTVALDKRLGFYIALLVKCLDPTGDTVPLGHVGITLVLRTLINFGLEGPFACRLIVDASGVDAILSIMKRPLEGTTGKIRAMALRTLATVCCVSEGIEYLNKINGIALIADILCDPGSSEEERREAAGVMAQLTSPWVDLTGTVDLEAMCTKKVVTSLTELCETGESQETYLLACAALANLTYAETQCADVMREISTPKRLISASSRHERNAVRKNIFACDQIATILANLAANPSWHKDLSAPEVVDVLSSFLFENVGENDSKHHRTKAERAALERVLQKTIVAISRISCEPHVAKSFISNKSLDRISQLCQDPEERMKSEAILVASMACIRKIAATLEDPSILSRLGPLISSKASPRSASAFLNNLKQPESYV